MADENPFKPGDVVQLKSGGCPIVIQNVCTKDGEYIFGRSQLEIAAGEVFCIWMDEQSHIQERWIYFTALRRDSDLSDPVLNIQPEGKPQ